MRVLSSQQRRPLKKFLARPPSSAHAEGAESFLLKYLFVEALCRLLGKYFGESGATKKKPPGTTFQPLKIDQVSKWLKQFGIHLSEENLTSIFDSSRKKRGEKSARNLRNGIVHHWNAEDVSEATERYLKLSRALDAVVNAVSKVVNERNK